MVLVDQNRTLAAIQAQIQGKAAEQVFLLEGTYIDGAFLLENFIDVNNYIKSSRADQDHRQAAREEVPGQNDPTADG